MSTAVDVNATNIQFISNVAKNGAALTVSHGATRIRGCQIQYNQAFLNGAGMYVRNGTDVHVDSTIFTGNSAENYGAGMFLFNSTGVSMSNIQMTYNTAVSGGGDFSCWANWTLDIKLRVLHEYSTEFRRCSDDCARLRFSVPTELHMGSKPGILRGSDGYIRPARLLSS